MVEETMKKILVIEDRAETRNYFIKCLEAEGFYTIGAENGLIGVQQVQEELPNLIICDIKMPLLDGYAVSWLRCAKIRGARLSPSFLSLLRCLGLIFVKAWNYSYPK